MDSIAVIGMGHIGLALSIAFGKKYPTIGFDINNLRVAQLRDGIDVTLSFNSSEIFSSPQLKISSKEEDISESNIFIITVPTPVHKDNTPDLSFLDLACRSVAKYLRPGNIVVVESSVYPGCTEEYCVPILEKISGLKYNQDFYCGYSPERINCGDKERTLEKIVKVVSGSTTEVALKLSHLYEEIIPAGVYVAPSLKVAETAKAIENTQRDLNVAFVNEISKICNLLNIETLDVLKAAETKWNFASYRPGLVGGHCISVDPYYLAYKAKEVGYNSELIFLGRRLNDSMAIYVVEKTIKEMIRRGQVIQHPTVLILGATFKENCPDDRNSQVNQLVIGFKDFGCDVKIYDPYIQGNKDLNFLNREDVISNLVHYSAIVIAVAHQHFKELPLTSIPSDPVVFDLKGLFGKQQNFLRL